MKRAGTGSRRGRHNNSFQNDENWRLKPLHDQNPDAPTTQHLDPTTSNSELTSKPLKPPQNRRNYSSGPRGRRPYAAKPQFEKKHEASSLNSRTEGKRKETKEAIFEERKIDSDEGLAELSCSSYGGEDNLSREEERIELPGSVEDVDDVAIRLEELRLNGREEELSEELLRINDQLQEDELLAMESIFGDDVIILDKQADLRSFQIHVHMEDPNEFNISTKLNDNETKTEDTSNDFSYSFKVKYLPPIILTCLLPKSYPTHLPPYFTISTQWLGAPKIFDLCSMLDSIWNEQKGQEVIYQWVEWLHGSSLSYLGLEREIILGPYGSKHTSVDRRAISGSVSPDADIPSIKSYNDEQHHLNFCKDFHQCFICFSEFAGTDFVRLPCQHFYCYKCMQTYSDMHVKEGTISKLLCPDSKCGGMIPPGLLKRLLGDEEFEHWESMMLTKTLESMSDVAYCPRCETACIEDEDQHAQCSKCFFSFCTLCRERRHVGIACMTPEIKLKILEERQNSTNLKEGQKQREREMINELLSVKEILRDAKQCPSCKMAISRIEGCNKMVCNNCGSYFCYRCNKKINGYDHFREAQCELFPQEMIQNWAERINERQVVGQIQAQMFADRGHSCPNCGQMNVKVGNNNHIFCWACQNHYYYLCRKMLRRSSQHYGPKGCKQHSVG